MVTSARAALVFAFASPVVACASAATPPVCPCVCTSAAPSAPPSTSIVTSPPPDMRGPEWKYTPRELAYEHAEVAARKGNLRDGAGCLAELAEHDKLDPRRSSADATHSLSYVRAQCLMLIGKCVAGRALATEIGDHVSSADRPAGDWTADGLVALYCEGGDMTPRDRVLRAFDDLSRGAQHKYPARCRSAYETAWSLRTEVQPRDEDDIRVKDIARQLLYSAPRCFALAGDCEGAWATHAEIAREVYKGTSRANDDSVMRPRSLLGTRRCAK